MALYRTNTATFIAPDLIPEGKLIDYDGPPGPHLTPVNDQAHEAVRVYYENNPGASLNPVDALARTVGAERPAPATATVLEPERPRYEEVANYRTLADPGKATPGPTELDGKIPENERIRWDSANNLPTPGGPGPRVMPDPDGVGSNAPRADFTIESKAPYPNGRAAPKDAKAATEALGGDPFSHDPSVRTPAAQAMLAPGADDPSKGDPSKPGEKPDVKAKADAANAASAKAGGAPSLDNLKV